MANKKEICRLCAETRKNMRSVYDAYDDNFTYAEIINSFRGQIMIREDEVIDKMCSYCKRKVIDTFDFINVIEQSTMKLYQKTNRIMFNDIKDVKIESFFDEKKVFKVKQENIEIEFKNGEDTVQYNETIIKKVEYAEEDKQQMNLSELFNLQDDIGHDFNDDDFSYAGDSEIDMDYMPLLQRKIKSTKTKRKRGPNLHKENHLKKVIKPTYRDDVAYQLVIGPRLKKRPTQKKKETSNICPYCGKLVKFMETHILTHIGEKKFKCNECSASYFSETQLKNHQLKHNPLSLYKCDHCIAVFHLKGAIQSHMSVHNGERKFVCDVCKDTFKRRASLARHKLLHQNKTVQCELCPMNFRDKPRLRHHMRVHTGERPFKCEMCSQPYSYKRDFNRHCFKKHGVFLKDRPDIHVMNEEVLEKERQLMSNLILKVHGVIQDDKPLNPFSGPHSTEAFNAAVNAIKNQKIQIPLTYGLLDN